MAGLGPALWWVRGVGMAPGEKGGVFWKPNPLPSDKGPNPMVRATSNPGW